MTALPKSALRFKGRTVLVTGGGGFLGKALVKALLSEGAVVRTIQRKFYPELAMLDVEQVPLDISSNDLLNSSIFEGVTDIFHTAAKVEMWGKRQDFYNVNVVGTHNLLDTAKKFGIKNFIFTSSPSVIASGKDLCGVDESISYPSAYHAFYPETKAIAEQEVRAINNQNLRTIILRPHLIYGPGDTSLEALIVKKAKAGRLVQVGDGSNKADFCHIEDCVEAHLLAAIALEKNNESHGKVFFISQGKPVFLWEWIRAALKRNQLPPLTRKISSRLAMRLGSLFEFLSKITFGLIEPPFTRFLAEEMATDHYFDITAARTILGFQPKERDMFVW